MRRLVLDAPYSMRMTTVARPVRRPGHALVRVRCVGVCGSDVSGYRGDHPFMTCPRVLGHELGAEVVEVDPGETRIAPGDRVAVEPYFGCGRCYPCRRGRVNCCTSLNLIGIHSDGGLQEYLSLPVEHLHSSGHGLLSYEELALVETASVGAHAVERAAVTAGELVFIIGAGPIGIGAMQAARARGAVVAMADINDSRLATAMALGAHHVVNTAWEDGSAWLANLTRGEGAPVVLEAVGRPETIQATVDYAASAGRIVIVGNGKASVTFPQTVFLRKELDFLGSRNSWGLFPELIRMMETGRLRMLPLITHRFPFDDAVAGFEFIHAHSSEVVKAVVEF